MSCLSALSCIPVLNEFVRRQSESFEENSSEFATKFTRVLAARWLSIVPRYVDGPGSVIPIE